MRRSLLNIAAVISLLLFLGAASTPNLRRYLDSSTPLEALVVKVGKKAEPKTGRKSLDLSVLQGSGSIAHVSACYENCGTAPQLLTRPSEIKSKIKYALWLRKDATSERPYVIASKALGVVDKLSGEVVDIKNSSILSVGSKQFINIVLLESLPGNIQHKVVARACLAGCSKSEPLVSADFNAIKVGDLKTLKGKRNNAKSFTIYSILTAAPTPTPTPVATSIPRHLDPTPTPNAVTSPTGTPRATLPPEASAAPLPATRTATSVPTSVVIPTLTPTRTPTSTPTATATFAPPPIAGMVGWWKMDEGSGGVAIDSTGSGHSGTIHGSAAWAEGTTAGALSIQDHSGAYVTLPSAMHALPITYSLWFNTTTSGILLSDSDHAPSDVVSPVVYNTFLYVRNDGFLAGGWRNGLGGYPAKQLTSATTVNDGHWHLAVVTNNGTTQSLYLDGDPVGSQPAGPLARGFLQMGVGWTPGWDGTYWGWWNYTGLIDDARAYNRVLSSSEVAALYNSQFSSSVTALSCSESDVRNALNHVRSGGTVNIPAGTCTWTDPLVVDRAITLQGAGIGQTIIVDGIDFSSQYTSHHLVQLQAPTGALTRLTGMTFEGGTGPDDGWNKGMILVDVAGSQWRVDHIRIHANRTSAMYVYSSGGVIDHNVFDLDGWHAGIYGFNSGKSDPLGDSSWTRPDNLGSGTEPYFVEDNVFNEVQPNSISFGSDGWNGQRVVFRHNTLNNVFIGNHGLDTTVRGARSFEYYNNTFNYVSNTDFGAAQGIMFRSGNGVVFNNVLNGRVPPAPIYTDNYRDWADFGGYGACDGSSPYDINDGVTYATGTTTSPATMPQYYQIVTDANANWTTNQWAGYSLFDTTQGGAGTMIVSNTAHTLSVKWDNIHRVPLTFSQGHGYKILRATVCMDQMGRGAGQLMGPRSQQNGVPITPQQLAQVSEKAFAWGNTQNGAPLPMVSGSPHITEGKDMVNGSCPIGYVPFTYPHPLTGQAAQAQNLNCSSYVAQ